MNERIQELARESDLDWHKHWNDDESNRLETFAKLIVQECQRLITIEHTALDLPEYNLGILEGYRRGRESMNIYFSIRE